MATVELSNLHKAFGSFTALYGVAEMRMLIRKALAGELA